MNRPATDSAATGLSNTEQATERATLVLTTLGSIADAEALAERLVAERLAACVSLGPVRSVYRWKDSVERADEVALVIKSSSARLSQLLSAIEGFHAGISGGYELPELLTLEVSGGSEAYLQWLLGNVAA